MVVISHHLILLVLSIILLYVPKNHATHGGNDIFTSLEAMRRLWLEERVFVGKIEQVLVNLHNIVPELER